MKPPLIFDIKRASTSDGPGIRTVIFFKGCNLDCFWCHNPEGKSPARQSAFFSEKCISCGACKTGPCPTQARRIYGKEYSIDMLLSIIKADKSFFDATGGGVTFSGGECMLYPEFLAELAKKCKEKGISVAIDTAGNVPFSAFATVMPYADIFLYDMKCLDPDLHRKGTGNDNTLILQNLHRLIDRGKRVTVRVPSVPGFNEGEEFDRVKRYCEKYGLSCEVLPYHTIGESKKEAIENAAQLI